LPKRVRSSKKRKYLYLGITVLVVALAGVFLLTRGTSGTNSNAFPTFPLAISQQNPVLGSKSAPYTIFEFGDFQCPTCDYWYKTQEKVIVQNLVNPGKAKLVWFDFIIYNSDSRLAANAAYAAGEQGKFWEFHDLLYANQGEANSGWVTKQLMMSFAQQLGLDLTAFTQSMNSGKYNTLLDMNFRAGEQVVVNGTPTFFVVGPTGAFVTVVGAQPFSTFQQAITGLGG
jgi:protein-disulfide isomerase